MPSKLLSVHQNGLSSWPQAYCLCISPNLVDYQIGETLAGADGQGEMMKGKHIAVASMLALQLSACGGGSSGTNIVSSTPAPPPPPPAAPPISSMTASPDAISFTQIEEKIETRGATGPVARFPTNDFSGVTIRYDGDNRYNVSFAPGSSSSESITYSEKSATSSALFDIFEKSGDQRIAANRGYASSLTMFRAGDSQLKLTYVTYGVWEQHQTEGDPKLSSRNWFLVGQLTPTNSQPVSGSATYTGIIDGDYIGFNDRFRLNGTGSLTYDFDRQMRSVDFTIDKISGSGTRSPFDTIKASMHVSNGEFKSGNGNDGTFVSYLMGPHAEEAAAVFWFKNVNNNGIATGVFVGKR